MCKRLLILIPITLMHFVIIVRSKCTNEAYGLYCTSLSNEDKEALLLKLNDSSPDDQIKAVFLRNSSGVIDNVSFSLFPGVKSLDIQYCDIEHFSIGNVDLQHLYLMNNYKFPILSDGFLKNCCGNLMTLYVVDNKELEIEEGSFSSLKNFNHLTINKQTIQNLTKDFLKGLNELTYLNLKENEIENVDEDAFEDMPNLSYLILNDNNISRFENHTFFNLTGLESLEFLRLNLQEFNISILKNQKELKNIGLPTSLIKEKIELSDLTGIFVKLESIILSVDDKDDEDINNFILSCEDAGFTVKFG